jgi:exosortase/archaeosortase family protein
MNLLSRKIFGLLIRYVILIISSFPNLFIFYFIFTPLTIYPVFFLFSLFFNVALSNTTIFLNNCPFIQLIEACIAGSAYFLLLILNLSIPNVKLTKRIIMILSSFIILLAVNIIRIFVLGLLLFSGTRWFDITHEVFWYFGSIVLVVLIWFSEVKLFKIKEVPFYSDIKFLYNLSSLNKKK